MNNNFSNLSPQLQQIFSSVPVYVSGTQNPDMETDQQVVSRQEKFLRLSKGIRWKLASFETGDKIERLGQKYGFELLRMANISRLIREYYFGEVRLENFPAEIEKRMAVSLLTAQEIARYIKSEIIDWDPWAQYLAKLPKIPVREIVERHPKIAETEITGSYVTLKNSEELEDPTIKNWVRDYVSHLGYEKHSQMDRAQYLFHSENTKNLSSPDREKLGIILKSFDENVPLPVDEENGEIVFDGLIEKNPPPTPPFSKGERPVQNFPLSERGTKGDFEKAENKQEPFIKPYSPTRQVQRPTPSQPVSPKTSPQPLPPRQASSPLQTSGQAYQGERVRNPEIDKYFSAPESPDIPGIKVHSITEHNEPPVRNASRSDAGRKTIPQQNIKRPTPTQPAPMARPQHKIIDPFGPRIIEPKLDGNIVDLSSPEE